VPAGAASGAGVEAAGIWALSDAPSFGGVFAGRRGAVTGLRVGTGSDAAGFASAAGAAGAGDAAAGMAGDSVAARAPLPLLLDRGGGGAVAVAAALGAPLAAPPSRTPRTKSAIGGSTTLS